jgi:phosphocarrier protein HPr
MEKKVNSMVKAKIKIKNPTGLHLRPAGVLCNEAVKYECSVSFQFRNTVSNAKSVLSVLGACIKSGDEIEFICDGKDEEEALSAMIRVVDEGLGE